MPASTRRLGARITHHGMIFLVSFLLDLHWKFSSLVGLRRRPSRALLPLPHTHTRRCYDVAP